MYSHCDDGSDAYTPAGRAYYALAVVEKPTPFLLDQSPGEDGDYCITPDVDELLSWLVEEYGQDAFTFSFARHPGASALDRIFIQPGPTLQSVDFLVLTLRATNEGKTIRAVVTSDTGFSVSVEYNRETGMPIGRTPAENTRLDGSERMELIQEAMFDAGFDFFEAATGESEE